MIIYYDDALTDNDKQRAHDILMEAYHSEHYEYNANKPFGYVYRVITSDNQVYIGKRKIQAHTDWFKYLGSGAKLDKSKVIRKEFICFGFTPSELHELECKHISDEIRKYEALNQRELVLNMRVNVTDSYVYNNADNTESGLRFKTMLSMYDAVSLFTLYSAYGSEQKAADAIHISRRMFHKLMLTFNVNTGLINYSEKQTHDKPSVKHMRRRAINSHACEQCGASFIMNNQSQKYCSHECAHASTHSLKSDDMHMIQRMLNDGMSMRAIARHYHVSHTTVVNYVRHYSLTTQ